MNLSNRRRGAFLLISMLLITISSQAAPTHSPPGRTLYQFASCFGAWQPEEPKTAWGLFDVTFDENEGPTESQRDAIRAVGGRIIYEFHVPVIRARLPVSAVPTIVSNNVQSVLKPREHVVDADFGFPTFSDGDRQFLEDLGVVILYVFDYTDLGGVVIVFARVPDESIPAIRIQMEVLFLEVSSRVRCPQS